MGAITFDPISAQALADATGSGVFGTDGNTYSPGGGTSTAVVADPNVAGAVFGGETAGSGAGSGATPAAGSGAVTTVDTETQRKLRERAWFNAGTSPTDVPDWYTGAGYYDVYDDDSYDYRGDPYGGFDRSDYQGVYRGTYGAGWAPDDGYMMGMEDRSINDVETWLRQTGRGHNEQGWEMGQYDFVPDAAIQPYVTNETVWDGEGGASKSLAFNTSDYIGDQLGDLWQQRFEDPALRTLYAGGGGPVFNMVNENGVLDYMDQTYGPEWTSLIKPIYLGGHSNRINQYLTEIDMLLPALKKYAGNDPNIASLVQTLESPELKMQVAQQGHQLNLAAKASKKANLASLFSVIAAPLAAWAAPAMVGAGMSPLMSQVVTQGVKGGLTAGLGGGNIGTGALTGAASAGLGGMLGGLDGLTGNLGLDNLLKGALTGGVGGLGGGFKSAGLGALTGGLGGAVKGLDLSDLGSSFGFGDNYNDIPLGFDGSEYGSDYGYTDTNPTFGGYSQINSPLLAQLGLEAPAQSTFNPDTGAVNEYNPDATYAPQTSLDQILGGGGAALPDFDNYGGEFDPQEEVVDDFSAKPEPGASSMIKALAQKGVGLLTQILGGDSSDAPSFPERGEDESDEEYFGAVAPILVEYLGLDAQTMADAGLEPGTVEYMQYILDQADEIISQIFGGDPSALQNSETPEDLMQALRGKTVRDMQQLQRALHVRGQMDTLMGSGNYLDPFTSTMQDVQGEGMFNPAVAAAQRGLAGKVGMLGDMRGNEARDFIGEMLGRKSDLYGMQGAMNARKIREMLETMSQDDEERKKRIGQMGVGVGAGDMWQQEFESLGDPVIAQLLQGLGGDEEESRAALAALFGMES